MSKEQEQIIKENQQIYFKQLNKILCESCSLLIGCKQGCIMSCAAKKIEELEHLVGLLKDMSEISEPYQCEKCGKIRDLSQDPECDYCEENNESLMKPAKDALTKSLEYFDKHIDELKIQPDQHIGKREIISDEEIDGLINAAEAENLYDIGS